MSATNPRIPGDLPDWIADNLAEILTWGPAPQARGCFVPGCRRDVHVNGLCSSHRQRAKRAWNPSPSEEHRRRKQPLGGSAGDSETSPTPNTKNES